MATQIGPLTFLMGPKELGGPDDLETAIIAFIAAARHKLEIAVQEIESRPIAEAIIAAKARGLSVQVVIEGDYLVNRERAARDLTPFTPDPDDKREPNRTLCNAMHRAGIDVRMDYNASIFHQKFVVRDPGKETAALLTGSTNFTPTGTHNNLNHIVIVEDAGLTGDYHDEFREIWRGDFGRKTFRQGEEPKEHKVAGMPLRALFAPDHQPEMDFMKQIAKARERIDFAIFTFSERSSGIDDALVQAIRAGVKVRGVLDAGMGNQKWAATRILKDNDADIRLASKNRSHGEPKPGKLNKLHHKLMVIDGKVTMAGSFNYTGPANRFNDENILAIGRMESTGQVLAAQKVVADAALEEIDRIHATFGEGID